MNTTHVIIIVLLLVILYVLVVKSNDKDRYSAEHYTDQDEMFEYPALFDPSQVGENVPCSPTVADVTDPTGSFPGKFNGRYLNCSQFDPGEQAMCSAYGKYDAKYMSSFPGMKCKEVMYPEYTPCNYNEMRFTQDLGHGKLRAWCCTG